MDRFIVSGLNFINIPADYLKSNMDRFIGNNAVARQPYDIVFKIQYG